MGDFPFWILVPIIATIAWAVVTVSGTRARQRAAPSNLTQRMDELERRLDALEKRT